VDRQHVAPARRLGGMIDRRGEHGLQAYRIVVQKPRETHASSAIAAESA